MRLLANVTSLLSLNAAVEINTTNPHSSNSDASLVSSRIPLNETVFQKVRKTQAKYHSADFCGLQVTSTIGPTTNPELLLDVRLIFGFGGGTMYVDMTSVWGVWTEPRFVSQPRPAGYNILPSRLGMDIVLADGLMKRAGYVGPYEGVDVSWPKGLRLGSEEAYYCFLMEGNQPDFVYVGVNDGRVMTSLPKVGGLDDYGIMVA